jgi:hypothetical protein
MDEMSPQDLRGNLILLFRMLQVNTVICYDHWGTLRGEPGPLRDGSCGGIRRMDGRHGEGLSRAAGGPG